MSQPLVIRGGVILTLGEDNRVLRDHAIRVEDGFIRRIAPAAEVDVAGARVIDAAGKAVLPGWINAHMHFYSTLVRGLGKAKPSRDFVEQLRNLWWRLDRRLTLDDTYVSALVMALAAVRSGTTTLIDHHASPGAVRGSLDAIARAVKAAGVRACLCYEVSDRDGADVAQAGLEENAAFIRRCREEKDPQLRALFGLHAAFTLGDATLDRAAAMGRELGAGFHVHTAESPADQEHNVREHGQRVVRRLHAHGLLGPGTICAHCVHVDDAELDLLAEAQTMVAHNPQSNLNNAVGIADLVAMARRGITVGLGTDAMTVRMLEELRVALWAQHLRQNGPTAAFMEVTDTLLVHNPAIASRLWGVPLGRLAEGAAADIILVDYDPPTPLEPATVRGHVVFGLSQAAVDTTVAGGRVLMTGKRLELDVDEAALAARARELATALWDRF